ncbi:MAG: LytTR family DNA-binding domain-containing protein [Chitinophagaceae bacterium]
MLTNLYIENRNDAVGKTGDGSFDKPSLYLIKKRKTRLLVQKGLENILLKLEDIVLFYTDNKIVYVVDRSEKKYLMDSKLLELEEALDPLIFFRANRQYIININFIKSFRSYEKVKIKVDLKLTDINHCIIVSQETAPRFRRWIHEA